MTAPPRPPLTPEERELAQKLARIDASAPQAPSPALDARILAAARAALDPPAFLPPASASGPGRPPAHASRRPRAPRRWPMGVGVAATLALAVGIAWQLRPVPDAPQSYSEAPPAAREQRVSGPSADDAAMPPAPQEAREEAQAAAAPEIAAATPSDALPASKAAPGQQAEAGGAVAFPAESSAEAAEALAAPEPDIVFDRPAPVDAPSAPAAPPPPPAPPAVQAAPRSASTNAAAEAEAASGAASTRREAAEAKRRDAAALDRIEVTASRVKRVQSERDDAGFADQAIDDEPPATADSPAVQQAWLQRIRELIAQGQSTGAKASLQEFKRRYPQHPLPPDLRDFDQ